MAELFNTSRTAKAVSLAVVATEVKNSPELAKRIESVNVSVDAAKNSLASRQESPFQDGLFVRLVSDKFDKGVGVRFFERRDKTLAPSYSILVDICSDAAGKNVIRSGESLYGTMLRKSEENRYDVDTKEVVPFAENSFNLTPECTTAQTLEELFNALVKFADGKMMRVISTAYNGLDRRGERARLHVVSLVKA